MVGSAGESRAVRTSFYIARTMGPIAFGLLRVIITIYGKCLD